MNLSKLPIRSLLALGALGAVMPFASALAKPTGPASTQASPPKTKSELPAEVKAIHCLVGDWKGSASGKAGPDAVSAQFTLSCTQAAGGYGVQCKTRFTGLPGGAAEETDLFGFDPGRRKYHWFSVTSQGETHDHVAEMPSGNTLRFVYDGVQEGKAMQEVITLKISDDHRNLEFKNTVEVGGQLAFSLSGRGTK
jgi:hypothetical protein